MADKFWDYVNKTETCWLWAGNRDACGYGRIWVDGRSVGAHRHSYLLAYGDFDRKLFVCHRCDTPSCVNPGHLFLGTHRENMRDAKDKGRLTGRPSLGDCGSILITVRVPLPLKNRLDLLISRSGKTSSGIFRSAIQQYLEGQ